MHNYKTDQIVKLLNITIAIVLILGILAGIGYGLQQMKLSNDTWTLECTISMIVVWLMSAVVAALIICKRYHIEMLDQIVWELENKDKDK